MPGGTRQLAAAAFGWRAFLPLAMMVFIGTAHLRDESREFKRPRIADGLRRKRSDQPQPEAVAAFLTRRPRIAPETGGATNWWARKESNLLDCWSP